MKLSSRFMLPFTGAISILLLIGILGISIQFTHLQKSYVNLLVQNKVTEFRSYIDSSSKSALQQAAILSRRSKVIEAFEIANKGNTDDPMSAHSQEARKKIRQDFKTLIKAYTDTIGNKPRIHFHLANGRSLVRLWREKQAKKDGKWVDISDDLSSFRKTVLHVNEDGKPRWGIEAGRGGFTIRGLAPVISNSGKQLGSVEVLHSFDTVLKQLESSGSVHSAIFMNKGLLSITTKLQDPKKHPVIADDFVLISCSNKEKIDTLSKADLLQLGTSKTTFELAGKSALAATPIRDYNGQQIGVLLLDINISEQDSLLNTVMFSSCGGLIFLIIISCIITLVTLKKYVVSPLNALINHFKVIEDGDYDSTVNQSSSKEMEDFSNAINAMGQQIKNSFAEIEKKQEAAQSSAGEAAKALEQAKLSEAKTEELLSQLAMAAGKAEKIAMSVSTAVEQLVDEAKNVNSGVTVQRDRMSETATAVEQITLTISEVAHSASEASSNATLSREKATAGAHEVHEAVNSIKHIENQILELKITMNDLGRQASSIEVVLGVISDIADQTNLLALNAAIEAARAGEAGRGFAVVADEVRKLAEKTMDATKEVETAIRAVQTVAEKNVHAVDLAAKDIMISTENAEKSGVQMEEIISIVDATAHQIDSIATASEEQSVTSEQISKAVSEVSDVAVETADGMKRSAENLTQIADQIHELNTVINQMSASPEN